jgi:hypothetical protein
MIDAYKILVVNHEVKRPLEGQAQGGGSIKMSLQEIVFKGVEWINLDNDRLRWGLL